MRWFDYGLHLSGEEDFKRTCITYLAIYRCNKISATKTANITLDLWGEYVSNCCVREDCFPGLKGATIYSRSSCYLGG
jgi:hypothetical protein